MAAEQMPWLTLSPHCGPSMIRHSIRSRRLELEKRSLVVNQKQMLRLMREANLLRQPKRFVVTTARPTLLSN
jgi:hypothetical protein